MTSEPCSVYMEVVERFPELRERLVDYEDLAYCVFGELVDWLGSQNDPKTMHETTARVLSFIEWCKEQPRTDEASTDIYTMLVVGFYENLFRDAQTQRWLPLVLQYEDLVANREYLESWVGRENYAQVVALYEQQAKKLGRRKR